MIKKIKYGEWENNIELSNNEIELVATLDVGPRIIRFAKKGEQNIFNEMKLDFPDGVLKGWKIYGGHRLWMGPEKIPQTYSLDNFPIEYKIHDDFSFSLIRQPEKELGIQKQIDVSMSENENKVTVNHKITNIGDKPIELACWALSVMAKGGRAFIPLSEKVDHFERYCPAYTMSLWSYTNLGDKRLTYGKDYISIDHKFAEDSFKIGIRVEKGWVSYLLNNTLFVNSFPYNINGVYPDGGVNFETCSNNELMELESIGELKTLQKGETAEHIEKWELFFNVPDSL